MHQGRPDEVFLLPNLEWTVDSGSLLSQKSILTVGLRYIQDKLSSSPHFVMTHRFPCKPNTSLLNDLQIY